MIILVYSGSMCWFWNLKYKYAGLIYNVDIVSYRLRIPIYIYIYIYIYICQFITYTRGFTLTN